MAIGIMIGKGGSTCAFCSLYFTQLNYFTPLYYGFVIGICNVGARGSAILSPLVAETSPPTAMICCIISSVISLILCTFLKVPDELLEASEN